ncbi:MAG: AHH domain-containing protein [Novosphingobium sp.]|nr:AHH domain-containing protein [Novosphingobium sp.]
MVGEDRHRPDRPQPHPIPFSAVNRTGRPGYVPGLQRHHLIPRALVGRRCFAVLFAALGSAAGFDDFRRNGILLPASETGALRMGLPLHRGPHRAYSTMVADRLGEIERRWALGRDRIEAAGALAALQRNLRRELLSPARRLSLNIRDPLGHGVDFSRIDALVDQLWGAIQREYGAVFAVSAAIAA